MMRPPFGEAALVPKPPAGLRSLTSVSSIPAPSSASTIGSVGGKKATLVLQVSINDETVKIVRQAKKASGR